MVDQAVKNESTPQGVRYLRPKYEVRNKEGAYFVDVYMPGVGCDGANITLDGDTLAIEARRSLYAPEGWKAFHREIHDRDYKLHLQLNVDIDPDGIKAKSDAGILTVTLPVAAKAAQHTIPIS